MDFYEKLSLLKSKNKLSNKDLGSIISKEPDAFRMAISRRSLTKLEKEKLKSELNFGSEKKEKFSKIDDHDENIYIIKGQLLESRRNLDFMKETLKETIELQANVFVKNMNDITFHFAQISEATPEPEKISSKIG